jgi:aldehyde dehydrogenase family 7 protein A1
MLRKLTYSKYPFLKELGLVESNKGCFRKGEWVANGGEYTSVNPSTHEAIATIKLASVSDYQDCIHAMS